MNMPAITAILERAECKILENLKCFIVSWEDFHDLHDRSEGADYPKDVLTKKHQLENFELKLSSIQEGTYYVCAKSEPLLDHLWQKKYKGP